MFRHTKALHMVGRTTTAGSLADPAEVDRLRDEIGCAGFSRNNSAWKRLSVVQRLDLLATEILRKNVAERLRQSVTAKGTRTRSYRAGNRHGPSRMEEDSPTKSSAGEYPFLSLDQAWRRSRRELPWADLDTTVAHITEIDRFYPYLINAPWGDVGMRGTDSWSFGLGGIA